MLFGIRKNKWIFYAVMIAAVLTYGYEIANWTMTIDEEIWSYVTKIEFARGWIGDGRWGIALLKLVLPFHKVLPFFNGLCAVIVVGISAFFLGSIFQTYIPSKLAAIGAAIMFVTMPIHSYYLMFDTFAVELGIGFLVVIISGYYCVQWCFDNQISKLIIAVSGMTFVLAIYQSYYQVFVCMVCALLLLDLLGSYRGIKKERSNKEYLLSIIKCGGVLVASSIVYMLINIILQHFFYKSDYVLGYFRWSYVDFKTCIQQVIVYLKWLFTSPDSLFEGGAILKLSYFFNIIIFILVLIKIKGKRGIILLLNLGMILSICSNYILFAGALPLRTLQVIPIYCSFVFFMISCIIDKKIWSKIVVVVVCVISLYQSSLVVELFYSENVRQEQDKALLNRIIIKIEDLELGEYPEYPIVITGNHEWNGQYKIETEQFNLSMFNTPEIFRKYKWISVSGYTFVTPTVEQQTRAEELAKNMPLWPYEGSVDIKENMIIVNFGVD